MEATNSLTRSPVPTSNWLTGQDTLRSNNSPSSFHSAGRQFFTDALEGSGNFSCVVSGAGAVAEAGISIVAAGESAGDATVSALGIATAASARAVAAVLLFGMVIATVALVGELAVDSSLLAPFRLSTTASVRCPPPSTCVATRIPENPGASTITSYLPGSTA